MLPNYFRVIAYNNTGQSTGGSGTVTVRKRGWYINSSGVPTWEASPGTTIYSNGAAITSGTVDTAGATAFDNGAAANPFSGMTLEIVANVPSGAVSGAVSFVLQASLDQGTTWPDVAAPPRGEYVGSLYFAATGTEKDTVRVD